MSIVRRSDRAALACFRDMHRNVRRHKHRMLAQPASYFAALADAFQAAGKLHVLLACHDGVTIAGGLMLEWGDTLYYKLNASIATALRPNDLLIWEGIELAHERGLAWFDFGLSNAEQEGLVRYKRKFATAEKEIVTLRHEPAGCQPPVREDDARSLGDLTTLLAADDRVPDDLLDAALELLYRNFA